MGVDPGYGRTGVAVVDGVPGRLRLLHAGCIETPATDDHGSRLHQLWTALNALLAEHRPDAAAVEQLFFARNQTTAMRVSEARGVLLCALAASSVPVSEYSPPEVKQAVAGYGGARKPQVLRMTARLLGAETIPGPDDAADACAIAVCHHHRHALGAQVRGGGKMSPQLEMAVARARAAG